MIVCRQFVFLHLHKSGGTFVNRMIANCIPYAREIGYHLPYSELPLNFRKLPVVGTVRNPWSYYVSWYHFQSQSAAPNALYRIVSENGSLGFESTIRNLLNLGNDRERMTQLRSLLPDIYQNTGINLTRSCLDSLNSDEGFYSFLYRRLYAGVRSPKILRMEALRESLAELVDTLRVETAPGIRDYLKTAPRINTSNHEFYQSYYSESLRSLVAEKDAFLIEKYRYDL